jgi:AcrR family transcriptional regulator
MASRPKKLSTFVRARKPEQRQARIENILQTAKAIARAQGAARLTLSELGRQAQLTKASVYRYFESLEHVLLMILASELEELAQQCSQELLKPKISLTTVADKIAAAYVKRPLLCELLGMVAPILEHNVGVDTIAVEKLGILKSSNRLASTLAIACPGLTLDSAAWVSHSVALYVAGAWPSAHPSAAAAEVLARAEFRGFQPNFAADLARLVHVLVKGVVQR